MLLSHMGMYVHGSAFGRFRLWKMMINQGQKLGIPKFDNPTCSWFKLNLSSLFILAMGHILKAPYKHVVLNISEKALVPGS